VDVGLARMNEHSERNDNVDPFRICSLLMLTVALLLSVFVAYRILRSRESFCELLAGFDALQPLSRMVLSPWYAWIVPTLAVLSVVKEALIKNRRATLICNGVQLVLVTVVWQLYLDGVFVPFLQLMQGLQ